MAKISAGILLHRQRDSEREVLLVHPGGPFWARKDEAAWSIPKGLIEDSEDRETAARREFSEEVGAVPAGQLLPLGEFKQAGGKVVVAFALEGDFDPPDLKSNMIDVEWPPRSGRRLSVPEVDRAEWFGIEAALGKLHLGQRPIVGALLKALS